MKKKSFSFFIIRTVDESEQQAKKNEVEEFIFESNTREGRRREKNKIYVSFNFLLLLHSRLTKKVDRTKTEINCLQEVERKENSTKVWMAKQRAAEKLTTKLSNAIRLQHINVIPNRYNL